MTLLRFTFAGCALLLLADTPVLPAAEAPNFTEQHSGEWQFSLLPRPFQKDPKIDLSVITEVTIEGRKLKRPTADHPAYYTSSATGYHDEGQGFSSEHSLAIQTLQHHLESSLTQSHYLVADSAHPSTLVIFFVWGSANNYDDTGDTSATDIGHHNLLARAALVGGIKFAQDYQKALAAVDLQRDSGMAIGPSPMRKFLDRDDGRTEQLVEQSKADCYYVVASAYSITGSSSNQRKLLWRTKMSANSQGVSLADTLPTLISAAATHFGEDMTQPALLRGNLIPIGKVEVGAPVVVPNAPAK